MNGRQSASYATTATSLFSGDSGGKGTGPANQKVFSMYNSRGRSLHGPDFLKRYKSVARSRRGGVQRLLFRWLRRPSMFLLAGFCLLVVPPMWFLSQHRESTRHRSEPTPDSIAELDDGGNSNLRTLSEQDARGAEGPPPLSTETVRQPPPPPEPQGVKGPIGVATRATAAPPPPTTPSLQGLDKENERIKRKHSEWSRKATMSPWQPPVLPVEVFRDVPPEECLQSPLTEKRVDASSYEFGCEEIYTMLMGKKKLIGRGYIRDVYLVEWEGRKLVVKFLREDYEAKASEARVEKIHRMEAAALDAVRGHPNIVDLLGICGASSVSEYYDVHLDDIILTKGAKPLPITKVVSMALDLARGLQALHEAPGGPIVHFDIKPQQMMMDAEGKLRINDLNLVRFPDADKDGNSCPFKSGASGVDSWRAPENIAGEYLTEKVDVYGMAMVFYSMLALFPPYTDVPDGTGNIKKGMPPTTDPSWHPGFLGIVQDMWNPNPKARPSARRVVQRLEILQQHLAMQTV